VLVLVGEQHLVDEAAGDEGVGVVLELGVIEHVERAGTDLLHIGAEVVAAQDRQLVADPARVLDRVVKAAQLAADRFAVTDALDEPELLEVGDVAEVPGKRAEDRRVDRVELLVGERLDEPESALACLGEAFGDALVDLGRCGRRDCLSLPR
jgi:hypothetical protein